MTNTLFVLTFAYPFIENGRTMVPLRILSENMQGDKVIDSTKTKNDWITCGDSL